jgi:hypothetical protein
MVYLLVFWKSELKFTDFTSIYPATIVSCAVFARATFRAILASVTLKNIELIPCAQGTNCLSKTLFAFHGFSSGQ